MSGRRGRRASRAARAGDSRRRRLRFVERDRLVPGAREILGAGILAQLVDAARHQPEPLRREPVIAGFDQAGDEGALIVGRPAKFPLDPARHRLEGEQRFQRRVVTGMAFLIGRFAIHETNQTGIFPTLHEQRAWTAPKIRSAPDAEMEVQVGTVARNCPILATVPIPAAAVAR